MSVRPPSGDAFNGPTAAAIVAAAAGCFAMGFFYVLAGAVASVGRVLSLYPPAGALSGVSTACILVWLAVWALLHRRWRERNVSLRGVGIWSLALLAGGLLLTFPPVARLF